LYHKVSFPEESNFQEHVSILIAQSVVSDVVGAKSYRLDACLAAELCLKCFSGQCRFKVTKASKIISLVLLGSYLGGEM